MATYAERVRRGLQNSGVLEPKTRGMKMRAIVPELDLMRGRGASVEDCMAYLKSHGLVFPKPNSFSAALYRARKAGPLPDATASLALSGVRSGVAVPVEPSSTVTPDLAPSKQMKPERDAIAVHHGVPVVRSTIHESKTDPAHPRMKDLV